MSIEIGIVAFLLGVIVGGIWTRYFFGNLIRAGKEAIWKKIEEQGKNK